MRGEFTPSILQPYWLVYHGLLTEDEAKSIKHQIISPEISQLILDWVKLEVVEDKFTAITEHESHFEVVRDLIVNIYTILSETRIHAIGINHEVHYKLESKKIRDKFGNFLSPLSNWDEMDDPKLFQIEIIEQKRKDDHKGYFRSNIQPSAIITSHDGVCFSVNDHIEVEKEKLLGNDKILKAYKSNYENSFARTKALFESIWSKFNSIN